MINKLYSVAFLIIAISAFASSSYSQNEDATVIALRNAVKKSTEPFTLKALATVNLERGVMRAMSDSLAVTNTLGDFVVYASGRYKGATRPEGYKQDIILDVDQALLLEQGAIAVFDRGIALIPPGTKAPDIVKALASMKRGRQTVVETFATIHSSAASYRSTVISTERLQALLKKVPIEDAKHLAWNTRSLANMNRAIALDPLKEYYEKRSQLHKTLGNTKEAADDLAKAASMP